MRAVGWRGGISDLSGLGRGGRELKQRKFEAFDELSHECEINSVDRVTGTVVIRIPEESGIRDHERG